MRRPLVALLLLAACSRAPGREAAVDPAPVPPAPLVETFESLEDEAGLPATTAPEADYGEAVRSRLPERLIDLGLEAWEHTLQPDGSVTLTPREGPDAEAHGAWRVDGKTLIVTRTVKVLEDPYTDDRPADDAPSTESSRYRLELRAGRLLIDGKPRGRDGWVVGR